MREIKFRGKRVDTSEWVYGYYVKCRGKHYILEKWSIYGYDERWEKSEWIEVIKETVGQFTGLKDRNGKEIYSMDIITDNRNRKWIIYFTIGGFKMELIEEYIKHNNTMDYLDLTSQELADNQNIGYIKESAVIIGNVFDNPELLEEK